jgi:uncharacterized membrane protein
MSSPQPAPDLRFGQVHREPEGRPVSVEWVLKRNCSMSPVQLMAVYASLCVVSLGIASYCWVHGATLVMPFAWLEMASVGAALWVYARHATDREQIALQPGRLTVEHLNGGRVERVEFAPGWVRIEPRHDDRSLIELSGQGHTVVVGRYVRPELRRALAEEFRVALRRWPVIAGEPA